MENKSKVLSLRVDEEVMKMLNEFSKRTGLKKKVIANKALKSYLKLLEQSDVIKFLSKE